MLQRLSVENYALISKLDIEVNTGFTVITGETGAGKSILLGALGLILGQRADTAVLLNNERKCVVEGTFNLAGYGLEEFFTDNLLDYDQTTILRREILPAGKSRAFINDSPVNLSILKELGERLVNVHSQNSITTLNDSSFQIAILDQLAGQVQEVRTYRKVYQACRKLTAELETLQTDAIRLKSENDYRHFLLDELKQAALIENEQEELEQRLRILTHAREIKESLFRSSETIAGGDYSTIRQINDALNALMQVSGVFPPVAELCERLRSDMIDLKDIGNSLNDLYEKVEVDPGESERCTARLDTIYHLQKKHQVPHISGLLEIIQSIEKEINRVYDFEEQIKKVTGDLQVASAQLEQLAKKLSEGRKSAKAVLEKKITNLLKELSLPSAVFRVSWMEVEKPGWEGLDRVNFLFSANKGVPPDDIARIASGGELSRLMLSIKSLISLRTLLPTIIFDEIDNGVSGEVAARVGNILRAMSGSMQVIAITHLPQIAGKGMHHLHVYKSESGHKVETLITGLGYDERVEEIARMLSNEMVTDAARKTARELMSN